jgi:hypothetical protein
VAQEAVNVGSSATLIVQPPSSGNTTITVFNPPTSGTTVYLGGSTVTTSTGFALTPGSPPAGQYNGPSAGIYGITSSGIAQLTVTVVVS